MENFKLRLLSFIGSKIKECEKLREEGKELRDIAQKHKAQEQMFLALQYQDRAIEKHIESKAIMTVLAELQELIKCH